MRLSVSLPSWERGLKWTEKDVDYGLTIVAPFVGAWIEIWICYLLLRHPARRSLRGSVD